jgi:UDP-glucose:(heptosyl)LPS alpha-1,3-glucosyltransferase
MSWYAWWQRWRRGKVVVESTPTWRRYFGEAAVQDVLRWSVQEIASSKQGRSVGKLTVSGPDGQLTLFLKRHYWLPLWQRLTVLCGFGESSAMQEWRNLQWAKAAGLAVPEALAAGEHFGPGLRLQSFLAVRELRDMLPLHQAIPLAWRMLTPQEFQHWKTCLLQHLGQLVRRLHAAQRFHKDLYLCHFFLPAECLRPDAELRDRIYLIDLHRMRQHNWLVWRWRTKDLAQLAFSMSVPGLEPDDWMIFFRSYLNRDQLNPCDLRLLRRVLRKAERYRRQNAHHAGVQSKRNWWTHTEATTSSSRSDQPSTPTIETPSESSGGRAAGLRVWSSGNSSSSGLPCHPVPLRIALCYDKVYPARGGMEVFIVDLIRRLIRDGHEVHLFAWQRDAEALPDSLIFHRLPMRWMPRFLRPWYFAQSCEDALRQQHFDVTVGFVKTWHQDVIILGGGLHVANADHNILRYRSWWRRGIARVWRMLDICYWSYLLLERKQFCRGRRPLIIAVSDMVKRHCQRYYHLPADRIRVLHAAIDPQRFAEDQRENLRQEMRQRLGIAPDVPVALFVGHNYSLKGLGTLLQAMQVLRGKPLRLLVCGSRKDVAYRQLAHRLGVSEQVHFLGYQADVRRCFFAADFVVHPTFYDPCSLVVMEALACGLPVITTCYNGAAELLTPPLNGFVLDDPHDYWRLAEYLDLLSQPDIRRQCSLHARRAAADWTMDHLYRALLDIFYEVAERKRTLNAVGKASSCCWSHSQAA